MKIIKTIEEEIQNYLTGTVEISEGYRYSQYKTVKRISLYANRVYPKGKIDKQGNYKYWYDIIKPRIDAEVKNIDFDTKDILVYSDGKADFPAVFLSNAAMKEWLRDNGQAEELNDTVEQFTGWGNILWKKTKDGYERADLMNTYIVNQTAKSVADTAVIERHQMTQSDLRKKDGVYKNVQDVIDNCGNKQFSASIQSIEEETSSPYYEIFERNGEVSEADLFEAQGKKGGDPNKYLLAKIVFAGLGGDKEDEKYVLFADKIKSMDSVYKEAHRGPYKGKWFREGMYELLMDHQTRANEIGNQIARGTEWASKALFRSPDDLIAQNILTDLQNGDIIRTGDLSQIDVRMQGLDQLIADWNRLMADADRIANSFEVVTGESSPSGTPFRLGALTNQNANKLFDFLREKLGIAVSGMFEAWILPQVVKSLRAKDVIRLTGDPKFLEQFYEMAVTAWYVQNLVRIGPHDPAVGEALMKAKHAELKKKGDALVENFPSIWENFKPRATIVITGEQVNLGADLETLNTFIALEQDPVRRTALIEIAMKKKGIDASTLPKSQPEQMTPSANIQARDAAMLGGEKTA